MAKSRKRPAESWTYVLASDRTLDPAEQSRFTLSPMTYAQRAAIRDGMLGGDRVFRNAGEIVVTHVVSIENFPARSPQPWPKDREDRERYLEQLDDDDVLELGNEVWVRSTLGVDGGAIKNFSPPELTSNSGGTSTNPQTSTPADSAPSTPA